MPKILAAGANQNNLKSISALLKNLVPGCTVITAKSGHNSIRKAKDELPDVILLDIQMPDMDGCEICTSLKADEKTGHIPVVMLIDAQTDLESRKKALEAGTDAFLAQPLDEAEVTAQVSAMLRIKKAEDALRKEKQGLNEDDAFRVSEDSYSRAFLNAPVIMAITRLKDSQYVEVNKIFENVTGYSREEAIGHTSVELGLYSVEDRKRILQVFVEKGKVNDVEFAIRSKSGEIHDVLFSAELVEVNGETCTIATAEDITARKQAEEKLKNRLDLESLISEISSEFVNISASQIDDGINSALKKMTQFIGANRSSLFMISDDMKTVTNTHEWCATAENSEIEHFQGIPFEVFGYYKNQLLNHETVKISNIDDYPPEAAGERNWAKEHGFRSSLFIPLSMKGQLHGALGLYGESGKEIIWADDLVDLFHYIGNTLMNALHRKKVDETLQEREEWFRSLVETTSDWIWSVDQDGIFTYASPRIKDLLGYEPEEIIGKTPFDLMPTAEGEHISMVFKELLASRRPIESLENINLHKDGHTVLLETSGMPVFDSNKCFMGYRGIDRNITERKRAEEKIKASLQEKEILLSEIHHRVKNNLQVISSLLNLQSQHLKDEHDIGLFKDTRNRVYTMAMIHEKIYQSNDLANINFNEYIRDLTVSLFHSYDVNAAAVKLKFEVGDIHLGVDVAIPCAQIFNELISNSLKYAFPEGRKGEVQIRFNKGKNGKYRLTISDNGIGFPKDVDFQNTDSLGLQLVNALTEQLEGDIKLDTSQGTRYTISF